MSISIVIVTYNSKDYVQRLLRSIARQTGIDGTTDIVLVDNNSDDRKELQKVVKGNTDKSVLTRLYLRHKNYGFAASSNFGAKKAKFSTILFINPDTELHSESLRLLIEHKKNNTADLIGGKVYKSNSQLIHRSVFNRPSFLDLIAEFSNLGKLLNIVSKFYVNQNKVKHDIAVDGVSGAYMLIDRKVFWEIGGFDDNIFMYLEDVDFCVRLRAKGKKIVYCPHSTINHVGGASSNNRYRIHIEAWFASRKYYATKHFFGWKSILISILYDIERVILLSRMKRNKSL